MPIVIEEMTVQVDVHQGGGPAAPAGQSEAAGMPLPQSDVIRQCVEEVMEVLRHQNER